MILRGEFHLITDTHLADRAGNPPQSREKACGWRESEHGWRAQGARVGWLDGSDLYLDADAAYRTAQRMASDGNGVEVSARTLKRRLRDQHLLISTDEKRETLTIRRMIEGRELDVLHIYAEFLSISSDERPDQPDIVSGSRSAVGWKRGMLR